MTVNLIKKVSPPDEAALLRILALADDVRVRDTRSGLEGVLWRVNPGRVTVLMGTRTFRVRVEHLVLVAEETVS
jgi:hypothetical protein